MTAKVTSLASSSSGFPSPPNHTPRTEASDVVSCPVMDFEKVGKILGPIEEDLNEAAEIALYPSPPANTPAVFSPNHSVRSLNLTHGRTRGLSAIGDRLVQLKVTDFPRWMRGDDSSTQSVAPTISEKGENDRDGDGEGSVFSNGKALINMMPSARDDELTEFLDSGDIPIILGSPSPNPRIQEYLAFHPSDLPVRPNEAGEERPTSAKSEAFSLKSRLSIVSSGGVTEKSNWAEEIVDHFKRSLAQLEQLAEDEHIEDSSKNAKDYYHERMQELLADSMRKYPLDVHRMG